MGKNPRTKFYVDIVSANPEVTGSCHLVIVKYPNGDTTKFLVDCGLFQEEQYSQNNGKLLICKPEEIEFVLVTHNHIDHTGKIPFLVKNGFRRNIYMTEVTRNLIPIAYDDSYKVLFDLAKRKNTKPIYEKSDVNDTLDQSIGVNFAQKVQVSQHITATFFKNAHLVGAAMILVCISYPECEPINLLFVGDYNKKNMFFEVEQLPDEVLNMPLTIIQEATYGTTYSCEIEHVYEANVVNAINQGKSVLSPVFSLGRAQEMLFVIKKLQKENRLSKDIPVYFDGKMARQYTNLYKREVFDMKENMKDFFPGDLTFIDKVSRSFVLEDDKPKIILTTSGMGSYGPAQTYIPIYLQRPDALIHFTGYAAENTLAGKLKKAEKGDIIEAMGLIMIKRADVEYTSEYSAHAKADEMLEFLNQFRNIKMILITHGETETKKQFANTVAKNVKTNNIGILGNGFIFRVDGYGLVKTMGMKLE